MLVIVPRHVSFTCDDVGPMAFTLDDLERLKVKVTIFFIRNILKTVTDTSWTPVGRF